MANYNVKNKAYRSQNPFAIQTLIIPDATDNGIPASAYPAQQQIMRLGDTLVAQTQTGAFRRFKIDAERSTSGYTVLLPV